MKLVNHLDHLSPPLLSGRYHRPHPIADPQRPDHDRRGQHGPHATHAVELKGACHRICLISRSDCPLKLTFYIRLGVLDNVEEQQCRMGKLLLLLSF